MAIIKIKKKDRYTVINNQSLTDARLSWKARGLWAYLMSLPPDWEVSVADLVKRSPDGRDLVYNILKELKRYGYIEHKLCRENGKIIKGEYLVFEEPHTDLPYTEKPYTANPDLEKPTLLNTNITKETNNKETAAIEYCNSSQKSQDEKPNPKTAEDAAADFSNMSVSIFAEDNLISDALTANQQKTVSSKITSLANKQGLDKNKLVAEVTYVLLNPKCFSESGNDFNKKLNTIAKQIREEKWTTPPELAEAVKKQEQAKRAAVLFTSSNLTSEIKTLEMLLFSAQKDQNKKSIAIFTQEIAALKLKLQELKAKHADYFPPTDDDSSNGQSSASKTRVKTAKPIIELFSSFTEKLTGTSGYKQNIGRAPCLA